VTKPSYTYLNFPSNSQPQISKEAIEADDCRKTKNSIDFHNQKKGGLLFPSSFHSGPRIPFEKEKEFL